MAVSEATPRPWEIKSGIQVWRGDRLLGCFSLYIDRKEAEANVRCFVQAVNEREGLLDVLRLVLNQGEPLRGVNELWSSWKERVRVWEKVAEVLANAEQGK